MRKILLVVLMVILALGLLGATCEPHITFEEVSQPYLDKYGEPDDKTEVACYVYWDWDLGDKMLTVCFFNGSIYDGDWWEVSSEDFWYTFEQISQPYLDQYGSPEDVYEYYSSDWWSITWWWWSKGFSVDFLRSTYDDVRGWVVDSTFSFSPI